MGENKTIKITATELKPCPFCGGEAYLQSIPGGWSAWARTRTLIKCRKCRCSGGAYGTKNSAIKAWNRRTQDDWIKRAKAKDDSEEA